MKGDTARDMAFDLDAQISVTTEQRRKAALYVCAHAEDVHDAQGLLEVLGLG